MGEFFSKFKTGIKNTGNNVKKTVDVNSCRLKAGRKKAEIEEEYYNFGKRVFENYQDNKGYQEIKTLVEEYCRKIEGMQNEIRSLESKIKEKRKRKKCPCGEAVPADVKFCPFCGQKF